MPCWGPEVFPLTILEALACGAPVIVRRAGGSAEAVERTGGGLVYDEPEELLPLIDRISADAELRATLSERGREGARASYLEDSWMAAYFAIIDEVARAKDAGRPA
jgi:glycosyltransferase involved in cell wall biosynthesis